MLELEIPFSVHELTVVIVTVWMAVFAVIGVVLTFWDGEDSQ